MTKKCGGQWRYRCFGLLCLALESCSFSTVGPDSRSFPTPSPPHSAIARLQPWVHEVIEPPLMSRHTSVIKTLDGARFYPADFKRPFALQILTDPWEGLAALEQWGLQAVAVSGSSQDVMSELIDALEAGFSRASNVIPFIHTPVRRQVDDHIAYIQIVLAKARAQRDKALRMLSDEDRQFLFERPVSIVEHFSPQLSSFLDAHTIEQAEADRRFGRLIEQMDYEALLGEAKLFAQLDNASWLQQLETVLRDRPVIETHLDGIAGDLLLVQETADGLIVIGGTGPNVYDLDQRFAVVIDVGGDDIYRGMIAAPAHRRHGASAVIDLSGDDVYVASPLGLGTGRLGVGLLVDSRGDDVYKLSPGSGGTGFAGIGILHDRAGRDQYVGSRFTQGAAVGGLGLLIDDEGNDTYSSFGYAIGFGGPLGIGAVIDRAGDDAYQCGEAYPSVYNLTDAPNEKPGAPRFQYDAFGIGAGVGSRMLSKNPAHIAYNLAGGWGLVIDREGNDRYRSSNFSQGLGYFFGVGMKLDLAGNDEHAAARYGHGASAHYGAGLFIDAGGHDRYTSAGPVYNGGVAWDLSVGLCIDTGEGDDVYDFSQSDGLGRADHRSWSFFIEEAGRDRYIIPHGMGMATDRSFSGFVDLTGKDDYETVPMSDSGERGNGKTLVDQEGGLFIDREGG